MEMEILSLIIIDLHHYTFMSEMLTRSHSSANVLSSTCPHVRWNVKSRPRWVNVRARTESFSCVHSTLNMVSMAARVSPSPVLQNHQR